MQHARVVRRREPRAQLPRDVRRLVRGQATEPLEHRREFLAPDVLHREEVEPLGLADVVDAADVAVRNLSRDPHLPVKARERRAVRRERVGQKLERDGLFELQVLGLVDLAHPAAPQEADDAVTLVEHRPRHEARVVERVRRSERARAARRLRSLAARRGVNAADMRRLRRLRQDARLGGRLVEDDAAGRAGDALFRDFCRAGRTLHEEADCSSLYFCRAEKVLLKVLASASAMT